MGIVGDIAALLSQAYKIWQDQHDSQHVSARKLYEDYILPSYILLREVHADYLDFYLELEERIAKEAYVSAETVQWFSRARARRQVDRSELRLLDLPQVTSRSKTPGEFDQAAMGYIKELRAYFIPGHPPALSGQRIEKIAFRPFKHSGSRITEELLRLAQYWSGLAWADQSALLAEEYYEAVPSPDDRIGHSEIIEKVMLATVSVYSGSGTENPGRFDNAVRERRQWLHTPNGPKQLSWQQIALDHSANQEVLQKDGTQNSNNEQRVFTSFSYILSEIVNDHSKSQRERLEAEMERVQRAFIRTRIAAVQ